MLIISAIVAVNQFACTSKNRGEEISDEIVLKVGPVEITKYEFECNKKRLDQTQGKGTGYSKKWLDDYIDETYLLADAYAKHYDMVDSVRKTITYTETEEIAQVDGYVWQKIVEPKLQFSRSELIDAYKKQDKIFILESLFFNDSKVLDSILNGVKIIDKGLFNSLEQQTKKMKSVQFFSSSMKWPFSAFATYAGKIYNLKEGDVMGPLSLNRGIYIIHLAKKENINQQPFNVEKYGIKNELKQIRTQQIADDKQKEIFRNTHIAIDENAVDMLSKHLFANKSQFNDQMLNMVLMTYSINGITRNYTGRDYWDYIHYFPYVSLDYAQKEIIDVNLKDHVIRQYLYCVADTIGILKDKKFCLDKRIFMNNHLKYYYNITEFRKNLLITDKELSAYYEQNKASYKSDRVSIVSLLTFTDKNAAINNIDAVEKSIALGRFYDLKNKGVLNGLISYQPNLRIENTDNSFPAEIINKIFSIPENHISEPFDYKGNSLLFFVTKREGAAIKEFSQVKNQIQSILAIEKFNKLRNQRVLDLKKKYTITVNKVNKLI